MLARSTGGLFAGLLEMLEILWNMLVYSWVKIRFKCLELSRRMKLANIKMCGIP